MEKWQNGVVFMQRRSLQVMNCPIAKPNKCKRKTNGYNNHPTVVTHSCNNLVSLLLEKSSLWRTTQRTSALLSFHTHIYTWKRKTYLQLSGKSSKGTEASSG